tara:strand:+ start:2754 stop:3407 length:654 start_codon:yes stop_codon:yes gene_type:complete
MKLCYFNGRGLAETARLLFAISSTEYEDFRYPLEVIDFSKHEMVKDEFDKDKSEGKLVLSLNKLPYLECDDGTIIPQSKTIERFLGKRFDLMGENDLECAKVDSICECVRDFKDMYQKVRSLPEEEKEKGMVEWFTVTLVEKLTLLEGILGENGFSVGSKLSLSDVVLFSFITQFFDNKEASYNATLATPRLKAIVDSVQSNEKVIEWLEKRPKTVF